jgi:hypothetical protein
MELEIIAIYCWCDLLLKHLNAKEDVRSEMTNAEVITTAIVAVRLFSGNFENARHFLGEHGYIPTMLSKSRLNRRLHMLGPELISDIQRIIGGLFKAANPNQEYAVDSFPVPVCENIRIFHSRIYSQEKYRGYQASKKRYFYGLKVHMLVTVDGRPVEFILTPGSCADVSAFKELDLDLPEGATVYGDKAYTDYEEEDLLLEAAGIELKPQRKDNAKRRFDRCTEYIIDRQRKMVETVFSGIARLFPKHIHAVTSLGFELKVALFACAAGFSVLVPQAPS